jgi:hypothetical protein
MRRALMLVCAMAGLMGCGSETGSPGGGGPGGHVVMTYSLFSNQPEMIAAGQPFLGTFTLPYDATVAYTVTNRSTTSPDHWDVSIIDMAEASFFENGQPYRSASPLHRNVSTISDSGPLAAGNYALALICDNIFENCQFSLDMTATF